MDRRRFLGGLTGMLAWPLAAEAQQSAKGYRIGLLIGSSESFVAPYIAIFRQALRALGYVEGGNIAIEYRYADGNYDRLPVLAGDLVRLKVDVVVTEGTPQPEQRNRRQPRYPLS
jgi:hypothetical protein